MQTPKDFPIPGLDNELPVYPFQSEFPKARLAQERLIDAGISPRFLADILREIHHVANLQTKEEEKPFSLPYNFTLPKLAALPGRIEKMADLIEDVGDHPLYDPVESKKLLRILYEPRGLTQRAYERMQAASVPVHSDAHSIRELPDRLRSYASYLREQIGRVGRFRKGIGKGKSSEFASKKLILELIAHVKDVTGEYHWTDLCDVLSENTSVSLICPKPRKSEEFSRSECAPVLPAI